ncbi:hypothetical protein [Streptomyces turgidiscabies]|uniref:Lipoprotein n=1 Tax=Streptomyces turgidiscabies TaxID=85558 RepID=A0ABU0RNH1_9ACTN|nr:hypothetical protein [Streptomyces turgidiscabies]MDQ0933532.1 hypothetical protein [Streptomyces turgidiscabies]
MAALGLVAAAVLVSACDTGGPEGSSPSEPRASRSSSSDSGDSSDVSDGKSVKAILDQAFVGRQEIGSGYGRLESRLGNTTPATPKKVLSVTFAFVCTRGGKISFDFSANGKDVPSAADAGTCDGSIFQRSVEIPKPGPMSFEAKTTGTDNGSFAYAYYVEKKELA